MLDNPYAERRVLRRIEKIWSRFEGTLNRVLESEFNPLYHLGTLAIFLLIVITVSGIYLTIFYRPGADAAYASVERISANWPGSLMRSIHRYASDALLLVVGLHAFKHLISDRFWGNRWLAWLSGLAMVALTWFIGTMGYWLVWDQRAQWLSEYLIQVMNGAVAVTFLSTDLASSTFAAFVIVLFLHIFIPLAILGLLIVHMLRLARARWWSPVWLMVISLAGLALVSTLAPARSAPEADLNRIIESVGLDLWYLGFLAFIERWGNPAFWGLAILILGVLALLPWLAKGRHLGPVTVDDPRCTGCALCALECPFRAIEMRVRPEGDGSPYRLLAVVNPDLCTGCGICVGTCATMGIELIGLPTKTVYQEGVLARAKRTIAGGEEAAVVFTCHRQAALGSLPSALIGDGDTSAGPGAGGSPLLEGRWTPEGAQEVKTLTCVLPCVGMVDADWAKELFSIGVKDIAMVGCPYDDCLNREGPQWLSNRIRLRRSLLQPNLHWLENTPGEARPVASLLDRLRGEKAPADAPSLPEPAKRFRAFPRIPAAGLALLLVTLLIGLALPMEMPFGTSAAGQGQLRVVVEHQGHIKTSFASAEVALPEHASVDAAQILGGERHPVLLQVWVDGQLLLEENHTPRGLRNEGKISGLDVVILSPGQREVEIRINDDGERWRVTYSGSLEVGRSQAVTLVYDPMEDRFRVGH